MSLERPVLLAGDVARRAEAEDKARREAGEYPSFCKGPWGTKGRTVWVRSETRDGVDCSKAVCNECNLCAEFRLRESSRACQYELALRDVAAAKHSARLYNKGEWQRLDGKPFLKHTPLKRR